MPLFDWLTADDSFQQAGVGLARRGMGRRLWKGGAEGGSEAPSTPPNIRLHEHWCAVLLMEHAVSHITIHNIKTCNLIYKTTSKIPPSLIFNFIPSAIVVFRHTWGEILPTGKGGRETDQRICSPPTFPSFLPSLCCCSTVCVKGKGRERQRRKSCCLSLRRGGKRSELRGAEQKPVSLLVHAGVTNSA